MCMGFAGDSSGLHWDRIALGRWSAKIVVGHDTDVNDEGGYSHGGNRIRFVLQTLTTVSKKWQDEKLREKRTAWSSCPHRSPKVIA